MHLDDKARVPTAKILNREKKYVPPGIKDILELRPDSNGIQIEQRGTERDSENSLLTAWVGASSYC